jgi:HSP20 family protein
MYMRRDDRDDPFDDIFSEIERMMEEMTGGVNAGGAGFGGDAHVSVYEADEMVRVVADMPSVRKEDIEIKCDGRYVTISASTDVSDYKERIELPARVDALGVGDVQQRRPRNRVRPRRPVGEHRFLLSRADGASSVARSSGATRTVKPRPPLCARSVNDGHA